MKISSPLKTSLRIISGLILRSFAKGNSPGSLIFISLAREKQRLQKGFLFVLTKTDDAICINKFNSQLTLELSRRHCTTSLGSLLSGGRLERIVRLATGESDERGQILFSSALLHRFSHWRPNARHQPPPINDDGNQVSR